MRKNSGQLQKASPRIARVVPMTRIMQILYAGALVISTGFLAHASSYRAIINSGNKSDTSAINQNFNSVGSEFSNTVHKTSTETIHGYKTFSDPLTVSTDTSINGVLNMNSHKITNLSNGSASSDGAAFGQIPTSATQSDQETGTSVTTFVSPGRQQFHPSASKAWVVFQGTGTVTILASYNVTSITDNGVGDYTINFTTSFSSANYAFTINAGTDSGSTGSGLFATKEVSMTASALRINTGRPDAGGASSGLADAQIVSVIVFGDQ